MGQWARKQRRRREEKPSQTVTSQKEQKSSNRNAHNVIQWKPEASTRWGRTYTDLSAEKPDKLTDTHTLLSTLRKELPGKRRLFGHISRTLPNTFQARNGVCRNQEEARASGPDRLFG